MNLQAEIFVANNYRERVAALVSGEYADDPRVLLLIAYTDLVFEHHASIMLLLTQEKFGSAFALVRVQFEAFMRANWIIGCATEDAVQKITVKEFEFPSMSDIASGCDSAFGTDQFFQTIKTQGWKAMNSYTHSGIRQLTRRFSGGRIEPNYGEEEIKEVIGATTTTVLLQGKLFCVKVGKHKQANEVERLIVQFAPEPSAQT